MAGMKGFDATQQARIHTEICARESRAAAKHAATDGAATFSLAATFKAGALAAKPNATRPSDWLVDEAGAAAAGARLAALAPRSRRRSDGGGGAAADDWQRVLAPSSNGEYGSHLALISAAVKAEEEQQHQQQQQQEKTALPTASGERRMPAAAMAETLGWSLGRGGGGAQTCGGGATAEIWAPENGRKSSSVTQFAATYVAMLGHSPFSSRGRSSGGGGGGGGGGKGGKSD